MTPYTGFQAQTSGVTLSSCLGTSRRRRQWRCRVASSQVNVLMWAVQPALAGALNREFRQQSQEEEDEDRLYPVVLVRNPHPNPYLTLFFTAYNRQVHSSEAVQPVRSRRDVGRPEQHTAGAVMCCRAAHCCEDRAVRLLSSPQ